MSKKIKGWIGVHAPDNFDHVHVVMEVDGVRKTINVKNPYSSRWLSDSELKKRIYEQV
jgi:hypothetical protein